MPPEDKKQVDMVEKAEKKELSKGESFIQDRLIPDLMDLGRNAIKAYVIPGLKKMADETFHSMLYGTSDRESYSDSRFEHQSYTSYYDDRDRRSARDRPRRIAEGRSRMTYIFSTRAKAEMVVEQLKDDIRAYRYADLEKFKKLVGEEDTIEYTDRDYGWDAEGIKRIRIEPNRNGKYEMTIPKPKYIVSRY